MSVGGDVCGVCGGGGVLCGGVCVCECVRERRGVCVVCVCVCVV